MPDFPKVTAVCSTKDRYFSTLPHTILAVCMQTHLPDEFIIYDDGEHRDLRGDPLYSHIFSLLDYYGLKGKWKVNFGERRGQVLNHIRSVREAENGVLWRIDDDNVPEKDVLEKLLKNWGPDVGAVGGLVIPSNNIKPIPITASNKIEDIYLGQNEQWYLHQEGSMPKEVDHLYSSFIYRKEIAEYSTELSPIGHREESILTFGMKKKGYKNILEPRAKTWHFCNPVGGIRAHDAQQNYANDEMVFSKKLREWGVCSQEYCFVVLDGGVGDHFAFKYWLPEFIEENRNKKPIFFTTFPEIFADTGIKQGSIADANIMFGTVDRFNIYKWMIDNRWTRNLPWAYRSLYKISGGGNKEKITRKGSGNTIIISPYSQDPNHAKSYPFWDGLMPLLRDFAKGANVRLIQIGRDGEPPLPCIDDFWVNRSFKVIEKSIEECLFWLSVDNFLQHLCHCMPVTIKGFVLWGVSDPKLFGYSYNGNILKNISYLRADQYNTWHGLVRNNDSFLSPEGVMEKIKNNS